MLDNIDLSEIGIDVNSELDFNEVSETINTFLVSLIAENKKATYLKVRVNREDKKHPYLSVSENIVKKGVSTQKREFKSFFHFIVEAQKSKLDFFKRVQLDGLMKISSYLGPIKSAMDSFENDLTMGLIRLEIIERQKDTLIDEDKAIIKEDDKLFIVIGTSNNELKIAIMAESDKMPIGRTIRNIEINELKQAFNSAPITKEIEAIDVAKEEE